MCIKVFGRWAQLIFTLPPPASRPQEVNANLQKILDLFRVKLNVSALGKWTQENIDTMEMILTLFRPGLCKFTQQILNG